MTLAQKATWGLVLWKKPVGCIAGFPSTKFIEEVKRLSKEMNSRSSEETLLKQMVQCLTSKSLRVGLLL